ncbi:MAG: glutamyl-tRNA reductase [Bryobacterales bacterium]
MSVLLVGLSHKTAPVEVREKFAIAEQDAGVMVGELVRRPGIAEAMVLSTCNRVEFLVRSETSPDPTGEVIRFLNESRQFPLDVGAPFLYRYADRDAVRHVFRVASSLDSMVVGEPQILGQVKAAYTLAKAAGALRGDLDQLLTGAFRVARRVRNETGIGQMAVSISYVAVELARKIFGDLNGLSILIIGAGKMSEAAARHLRSAGARNVYVTNRTYDRAVELAVRFDGSPVPFDRLLEYLTNVDIVISSTGSPKFILTKKTAEGLIAARKNRPIFLVDIAVPRDIDPEINTIDNMFVYDIDDLQQVADANIRERQREADRAEKIIEEEVGKMMNRLKTSQIAPTIISLHSELDRLRREEIDRFRSKLGTLTPEQEQAVEALTRSIINKIAHPPVTEMKKLASDPDGLHFVEFVKKAFNLEKK